jgi:hypothetical protein
VDDLLLKRRVNKRGKRKFYLISLQPKLLPHLIHFVWIDGQRAERKEFESARGKVVTALLCPG